MIHLPYYADGQYKLLGKVVQDFVPYLVLEGQANSLDVITADDWLDYKEVAAEMHYGRVVELDGSYYCRLNGQWYKSAVKDKREFKYGKPIKKRLYPTILPEGGRIRYYGAKWLYEVEDSSYQIYPRFVSVGEVEVELSTVSKDSYRLEVTDSTYAVYEFHDQLPQLVGNRRFVKANYLMEKLVALDGQLEYYRYIKRLTPVREIPTEPIPVDTGRGGYCGWKDYR